MAVCCDEIIDHTKNLKTPPVKNDMTGLFIFLAILNCFFFGWGVIIAGAMNGDMADVCIGLMQLLIPFVGWIWAIVWGILWIINITK